MPELPEVETIIGDLNEKIKSDTIVDFWSDWPKAIKNKSYEKFRSEIKNREILGARRIGKNIFFDLSGEKTLYIHLKMTGHLLVKSPKFQPKAGPPMAEKIQSDDENYFSEKVNQYVHHIFFLKSGRTLEFSDVRKFAKIVLDDSGKINELKEMRALGVDALSPEFTLKKFSEIIERFSKRPIGILLMDQAVIAGIGNIYRSEALFEAGILPERLSGELKSAEIGKLHRETLKVLKKAIKLRGTSDSDYRDTAGAPGNFQKVLKVYRREKQKCKKCGIMIVRKTLGQRSVFICPTCQI
jgi:formamidopyrimidine-DNA glycosylase